MSITTKEQDFATFCVWARDRGFKALRYRETPESLISRYGQKKAISLYAVSIGKLEAVV